MPSNSLDNFLDQLLLWTRQVIDNGRTPFRKVELNPPLITQPCQPAPHLTLWINRDSHMAGGLILLPEKEADTVLESGTILASALGLKTFATWDRQRVTIWSAEGGDPLARQTTPVGKVQSAGGFRRILHELLDQLKVLAVSDAPSSEELTPYWLANLLHMGLLDAQPEIEEHLRAMRPGQDAGWDGGRHPGLAKGLLTVCRLLAVGHADLLAKTVQAEGMERALRFSLDQLPDTIGTALQFNQQEPLLPSQATTRFHHLWRRLQQLNGFQHRPRLARAVELLLPDVDTLASTAPRPNRTSASSSLSVNPPGCPGVIPTEAEVASPAVLGWRQLLRWLQGYPAPTVSVQKIDQLPSELKPEIICAALDQSPPPDKEARTLLGTTLRLAWPSRRFQLPATAPGWQYDLLQILGRAGSRADIHLRLPCSWLEPAEGEGLWELISSDFMLCSLALDEDGSSLLELKKGTTDKGTTRLESSAGEKNLAWSLLKKRSLQHLNYALFWPQELYNLIETNRLLLTDEQPSPIKHARETFLYWQSGWGQQLAGWCGFDPAQLTLELLTDEHPPVPVFPHPEKLQQLNNLLWAPEDPLPEGESHDREIALWVGPELANPAWPAAPGPKETSSPKPTRAARKSLIERIEARLLVDGLPEFPEQYLYDHYRPELSTVTVSGPLTDNGRFFNQIELLGANRESLQVESEALAGCMILASWNRQNLTLPSDPDIAADILGRYLKDLRGLHKALAQECRRLQDNKPAAQRLAKRLWKRWKLPAWEVVEQVAALFSPAKPVN